MAPSPTPEAGADCNLQPLDYKNSHRGAGAASAKARTNPPSGEGLAMMTTTSPVASPPVPLPDWIRRARFSLSSEAYVELAVVLALQLANRLVCLVFGTNGDARAGFDGPSVGSSTQASMDESAHSFDPALSLAPSPPVRMEDIVTENVMVSVASNHNAASSSGANFVATEVHIQPADSKPAATVGIPRLVEREVCFALGRVLFELFSQGDPLLTIDSGSAGNNQASLGELLLEDIGLGIENDEPSPAPKRTFQPGSSTADAPLSLKAKTFLQERGLPLSVCQLVSDLLEAEEGNEYTSDTALTSIREVQFDLMQMNTCPERFLHDNTCPRKAWENTALFSQVCGDIYGRENEFAVLTNAAARVHLHVTNPPGLGAQIEPGRLLCEAAFLSGHSGSGKTALTNQVVRFCNHNGWLVLSGKFDRQVAPLTTLVTSVDSFLGLIERDPSVQEAFEKITKSLVTIDAESFSQLCELLPNLCKLFPMSADYIHKRRITRSTDPTGPLGSGSHRLKYIFHIVINAICSGGRPVAMAFEDLQWSDAFTLGIIGDFILTSDPANLAEEESTQGGLFLLGNFRSNEVDEDGFVMSQIRSLEHSNNSNVNVNRIAVGELPEHEINKMLSFKFCLPIRHIQELSQIVYQKTRGNPMFVIEFLRTIIQRQLMLFSVRARRWIWEDTAIEMQMISDGVVELLKGKLLQLSHHVIETLKIVACFGHQVSVPTIEFLDLGQFPVTNMLEALDIAKQEGIVDRAGPVYAWQHDLLQESTYQLIPQDDKYALHRKIGMSLAADPAVADNAELCTLAVDQINICKDVAGILGAVERNLFARLNLAAGRHSIAASSFEQARGYFEAGISLLHTNSWNKQYQLTLKLYEMSVVVSFMDGNVETVSSRLYDIFSNTKSLDDEIISRALEAKFLASQERYSEAINGLLGVLSRLGEDIPKEVSLAHVQTEVKAAQSMLAGVTRETITNLPPMTDAKKLNAVKFMGIILTIGNFTSPLLVAVMCCRLVKISFEFGYCEDTISGLAYVAFAMLIYADDIQLASQMNRITDSLIRGNPNEIPLRARLTPLTTAIKCFVLPAQATVEEIQRGHHAAKMVGDVDNALLGGLYYCCGSSFCVSDLVTLQRNLVTFIHQTAKHKRINILRSLMAIFDATTALVGNGDSFSIHAEIKMMSNEELYQVAVQTKNTYLLHHVILYQMYVQCYCREYVTVIDLVGKYGLSTNPKRILDLYLVFFQGLAALCLARDTKQDKWKTIGEKSVATMMQLTQCSEWNFENKLQLLQAELHYLNGRHRMAELAYQSSIASATEHKFHHEAALSCELYGIYLVENKNVDKGVEQLQRAFEKYNEWGATKKSAMVKDFIELIRLP